jgi:uncharacterized membrane protein
MLIIKHTVETTATAAQIWSVWQDVENWKTWDHDLESSQLNGPFKVGTTGSLKFKGDDPILKTLLTHVEPYKIFVQEAQLPLAKVIMTHAINQLDGKTHVTFQTEIRGILAIVWVWLLGSSIKKKIPVEMEQMLKKAETM